MNGKRQVHIRMHIIKQYAAWLTGWLVPPVSPFGGFSFFFHFVLNHIFSSSFVWYFCRIIPQHSVSITAWHITSNSAFPAPPGAPAGPGRSPRSPDLRIYIYITLRAEAKKRTHKVVSETWPECLIVRREMVEAPPSQRKSSDSAGNGAEPRGRLEFLPTYTCDMIL